MATDTFATGSAIGLALGLGAWAAFAVARVRALEGRRDVPWRALCGTGILAVCAPIVSADAYEALARGIVCIALLASAATDARTGYLFDAVTFPAALSSAAVAVCAGATANAAAGVLLLAGVSGSVFALSRGRWLGLGDVKALYGLGAAFGPAEGALAVAAACLCGLATTLIRRRHVPGAEIPFGPHLAAGAVLTLVFGHDALRLAAESAI
jgi:prepilin signal peptidase PulO-like enzyme (type II secretory pathway)